MSAIQKENGHKEENPNRADIASGGANHGRGPVSRERSQNSQLPAPRATEGRRNLQRTNLTTGKARHNREGKAKQHHSEGGKAASPTKGRGGKHPHPRGKNTTGVLRSSLRPSSPPPLCGYIPTISTLHTANTKHLSPKDFSKSDKAAPPQRRRRRSRPKWKVVDKNFDVDNLMSNFGKRATKNTGQIELTWSKSGGQQRFPGKCPF